MDLTTFISAVVVALLGLLPLFVTALMDFAKKRGRSARNDNIVDFANRQVGFLNSWLQTRELCDQKDTIEIKTKIRNELDEIKQRVETDIKLAIEHQNSIRKEKRERSYLNITSTSSLFRVVGIFGILLPIILPICGLVLYNIPLQVSISSYYHTDMRDVLTGGFFVIGVAIYLYQGTSILEKIISFLCGLSAMIVALFPIPSPNSSSVDPSSGIIHFMSFGFFLLTMSLFTIFAFITVDKNHVQNKISKTLFFVCGIVQLLSLVMILLFNLFASQITATTSVMYILESISFFAFGVAWLFKSQSIGKGEKKQSF